MVPVGAAADTATTPVTGDNTNASPCEQDERLREFDFWVGDWEVRDADGNLVGENTITREEGGCLLVEKWRGAKGSTGMSINYLDGTAGEWVQSWHAAGGYRIFIRGGLTDDGMLLSGTIDLIASGDSSPFRGLWTPLPDGRVRQYFEQSNDDGKTWKPWFEGFYSRKSAD